LLTYIATAAEWHVAVNLPELAAAAAPSWTALMPRDVLRNNSSLNLSSLNLSAFGITGQLALLKSQPE
jgi:hypothetical protein